MERAFEGTRKAIAVEKGWVFLKSTKSFFSFCVNNQFLNKSHLNESAVVRSFSKD